MGLWKKIGVTVGVLGALYLGASVYRDLGGPLPDWAPDYFVKQSSDKKKDDTQSNASKKQKKETKALSAIVTGLKESLNEAKANVTRLSETQTRLTERITDIAQTQRSNPVNFIRHQYESPLQKKPITKLTNHDQELLAQGHNITMYWHFTDKKTNQRLTRMFFYDSEDKPSGEVITTGHLKQFVKKATDKMEDKLNRSYNNKVQVLQDNFDKKLTALKKSFTKQFKKLRAELKTKGQNQNKGKGPDNNFYGMSQKEKEIAKTSSKAREIFLNLQQRGYQILLGDHPLRRLRTRGLGYLEDCQYNQMNYKDAFGLDVSKLRQKGVIVAPGVHNLGKLEKELEKDANLVPIGFAGKLLILYKNQQNNNRDKYSAKDSVFKLVWMWYKLSPNKDSVVSAINVYKTTDNKLVVVDYAKATGINGPLNKNNQRYLTTIMYNIRRNMEYVFNFGILGHDTNRDGLFSKHEFATALRKYDTNKSNKIENNELKAIQKKVVEKVKVLR